MKKVIKKLIETEVTEDVLCNHCGSSLRIEASCHDFYGIPEITVAGGYYSKYIRDGRKYIFSLCEKCVKELIDSFTIPAEETNNDILI